MMQQRYYDATIGRFISPDSIVPDPANPQHFNRYTYCLNNPLKYIDPSGHDVYVNGVNVEIFNDPHIWEYYSSNPEMFEVLDSPEFQAYNFLRSVEPTVCITLERSEIDFKITAGWLPEYRQSQWDGATQTITLREGEHYSFEGRVLDLAHECKHAFDYVMYLVFSAQYPADSFEVKRYNDIVYLEWSASKFAGNLDDKLGWHHYWWPFNMTCESQSLDLDISYTDYQEAKKAYFSYLWGPDPLNRNERFAILTEDDYKNR